MRIMQVVSFFSPKRGGGIIAVVYQLSRALAERGHEVAVFTSDFELDREYVESLHGVRVYPFRSYLSLRGRPLLMPGIIGKMRKDLKDFDIIHAHGHRGFPFITLHHYARKYGIPYIVDAHGATTGKSDGRFGRMVDVVSGRHILRDATRVIAETELGAKEYLEAGVGPDRITIQYPPFPVDDFATLPPPGKFRDKFNIKEKNIIMFLGRIAEIKGLGFLIESFYELSKRRDDVVLAIVGSDDGYESTLRKAVRQLNLSDRVLFTGFLDGEDKQAALIDAVMMIQPSVYEQGFPKPCIEAILCNTPAVVSKGTGAARMAYQMGAGYLVEYGNKEELRDLMQHILDNPSEAAVNTQKARNYIITNWSMQKGIEEYEKLYDSCLNQSRTGG